MNLSIHLDVTGRDGGDYALHLAKGVLSVKSGIPRPPDSTITLSSETLLELLSGTTETSTASMVGKIRVRGEPIAGLVIGGIVSGFRRATEMPGTRGKVATRLSREKKAVAPAALAALVRHAWPGNVRELRNVLERAAVLAPGDALELADLALDGALPSSGERLTLAESKKRVAEDYERRAIAAALREHEGNVTHAAESLGTARQSLQQRIKELGLKE
jgi:hypothetical protein